MRVFGKPGQDTFTAGAALVLFVASAFGGMWVAYDPSLSWPTLLALLGSVSLFLAIANSVISPRWVGSGLVIAASLVAFYFAGQYAHLDYHEVGPLAHLGRITGSLMPPLVFFTPHPNAVAGFLAGALLLSLTLTWQAHHRRGRLAWGVATAVIAYGLLISGSRGAWLGLAVVIGIWILLRFPDRTWQLVGAWLGLLAGLLLGCYVLARLGSPDFYLSLVKSSDTLYSRLLLYRNGLYLWGDYPFTGIGLGDTFAMVYSRYQLLISVPYLYYAHNLFLSVGLGQGLLGLVALVWLLISFYRFVVWVERIGLDARSLPLFRAAWLGTTATLVHGLADSVQFSPDRWTMLMLFALPGLAVAIGRPALAQIDRGEVDDVSSQKVGAHPGVPAKSWSHRRGWLVLAAIAIGLTVVAIVFRHPLLSAWYANLGAVYQTRAELSSNLDDAGRTAAATQAVTYFERALSLDPWQPVANRRLGMMALDRQDFETATAYLERAYAQEPGNQATLKALGYAYLWTGRLDPAVELFQRVDFQSRLLGELKYWHWWWGTQDREDLSAYADRALRRLSETR